MSLTAARRATLAALADSILPHGGTLEPGASDVNVAGQLDAYLDRCAPGARGTVNLMLTAFNLSSIASRHARPFRLLGPAAREAYLMDCEKSKIRQRRETLIALKALILVWSSSRSRNLTRASTRPPTWLSSAAAPVAPWPPRSSPSRA